MNIVRKYRIRVAAGISVVWLLCVLSPLSVDAGDGAVAAGDCVTWQQEARFVGVAYNHLVHLTNRCDRSAVCRIKTDVNPQEATVRLAPKEKKSYLTFRGSPARVFKATVSCSEK